MQQYVLNREKETSIVSRDGMPTALAGKVKQNATSCVERALLTIIIRMKMDGFNYVPQN
jgi:hypothetical protein